MPTEPLNVPFKGKRDYLQSANMWDAVCTLLSAVGRDTDARLTMTFRRLVGTQPVLCFPAFGKEAKEVAFADIVLADRGEREIGYLAAGQDPITARVDDIEEELRPRVAFSGERAVIAGQCAGMTPVEVVVASTKFLHQAQVDSRVKWLATRLELPIGFGMTPFERLEIILARRTQSLATISDVALDGQAIGRIYFNPQPPRRAS